MSVVDLPVAIVRGSLRLRVGAIGSLILLLIGFVSIVWTPWPIASFDIGSALAGPSGAHWLGADQLGRDILSLLMKGMLTSFVVSLVAVAIGALFGLPLGFAAARWPGLVARGLGGAGDFVLLFPAIVLTMLLGTAFGPSFVNVMLALGLANIPVFMRATRDALRATEPQDYVAAARLAGDGPIEIFRRHILPNIIPVLLATALAQLAFGVLAEASLSFVGLGAQPPATSLGLILRDGQGYAAQEPGLLLAPGLVLVAIVLALNAASGGVRDVLAPPLRDIGGDNGAA